MLIFQAMVYCLVRPQADVPVLKRLESTLKKHRLLSSEPLKATEKQNRLRAELTNRVTVLGGECTTHGVGYPAQVTIYYIYSICYLHPRASILWNWNRYFQLHIMASHISTLPSQVRPSDYQSDLDNRCVWGLYEMEGVRASWIFIMTSPAYWLWYGGHTQVRLSGLQELGREEGGSELIAHIRDIKESAGSRQLDRWRCISPPLHDGQVQ